MCPKYIVQLEIAGPLALFTSPDTGSTPTSYPVPTWSACKGLFESVAFLADGAAWIHPVRVEVCRRIGEPGGELRYQRYTTNYGGPLRKSNQRSADASFQLFATVLADVCYRLHGVVKGVTRSMNGINPRHYLQDLFDRRIRQGRCHRTPCLGLSEMTASYWGPFRDGRNGQPAITERDDAVNLEIPSLLHAVFDGPVCGRYAPRFVYNVKVENGVLDFEKAEVSCAR